MVKEMLISSSPHETKVALLEDDELVELYYQRDTDVGLVGGIYKGRVSRVLPGMQSAFVNIGLERDAFLYVSDFFEDSEEYDRVFTEEENRVARLAEAEQKAVSGEAAVAVSHEVATVPPPAAAEEEPANSAASGALETAGSPTPPPVHEPAAPSTAEKPKVEGSQPRAPEHHRDDFKGRRRRRGRRFRDGKFGGPPEHHERPEETSTSSRAPEGGLEPLPGESLAKYSAGPPAAEDPGERQSQVVVVLESGPLADFHEAEGSKSGAVGDLAPEPTPIQPSGPSAAVAEPERAGAEVIAVPQEKPQATEPPYRTKAQASGESARLVEIQAESDLRPPYSIPDDSALNAFEEAQSADEIQGEQEELRESAEASIEVEAAEIVEIEDMEASEAEEAGEAENDTTLGTEEDAETGAPAAEEAAGEPTAEEGGRSYTLREPQQRQPYAPRRRNRGKGRFNRSGFRREGPRKQEPSRSGNFQPVQIAELLKEGQEILVQIAKEPLGTKGARISSHIALPGRYLVFMPTINHIGVSRKIGSEEERLRLRNIIIDQKGSLPGGFIVRTAGAGRSEEELKADIRFLTSLWAEIRARADRTKAPSLLHRDLTLVERMLRDLLSPEFKTIRVDSEQDYENAVEFVNRCQPSLLGHVKLSGGSTPLFEEFGVQAEIDRALKPKVWLKSGGYIVINQTEALVAIDVNTGKYVGKTNRLEDTIVKVNIDAVREIVRQLRLRDLGGIIVVDFIDMDDRRNRAKVVQALEEALRRDRAPTKILSFNEFGLVALTRKRVKQSLERTLCVPCPYCTGSGWIKSATTLSNEIYDEVRKMAPFLEGNAITIRVHPEVAKSLKSRDGVLISEMEAITRKEISIKSDPSIQQERFDIF
jgi:Rne/Rng family ribonuclease